MEQGTLTYRFVSRNTTLAEEFNKARVVYVLRGQFDASLAKSNERAEAAHLEEGDCIAANVGQDLALGASRGSMALVCTVDTHRVARLTDGRALWLMLGPHLRGSESYQRLQSAFNALLVALADTSGLSKLHREAAETQLLTALVDGFLGSPMSQDPESGGSRGTDFRAYIDAHYDEPLQLSQVARHFHLSSDYLAKSFRREVGSTFLAYLTGVRLAAAENLLVTSDETIARVALEAGFPNVASFERAFGRKNGQTPSVWRKEHQRAATEQVLRVPREVLSSLAGLDAVSHEGESLAIVADASHLVDDPRLSHGAAWREDIGLGSLERLSDSRVVEQVGWLQERLPFSHARVWCDFETCFEGSGFYDLERRVDFLAGHGLSPHWVMRFTRIHDRTSFAVRLERLLRHFSNRYSVDTVRGWWFDLVLDFRGTTGFLEYLLLFSQVQSMLRRLGVRDGLFGPGLMPDADAANLREFLQATRMKGIVPDRVSIACRPAAVGRSGGIALFGRSADRYYLRQQVLVAREALAEEDFDSDTLLVGSWMDSIESSNIMNDSCYEGANLCRGLLSVGGLASAVCYDQALDLASDANEHHALLSGRPGLLSVEGIPKPSFFVFSFLDRIGSQVIHADERAIMSTNAMGNFQMVCHNCEKLNAKYLATPESALSWEEMPTYFESPSARDLKVRIAGVRDGRYLIKIRAVSGQRGSLMEEIARMNLGCMDDPSRSEIEHLRQIVMPRLCLMAVRSHGGVLEFSYTMQSNEVAYLHIIYEY